MTAVHSTIDNRQSTIPALRSTPNSSTAKQHQTLVIAASHKGLDLHEVRKMVGGSLRRLSAKECSEWIERFSGKGLPHPPGAAPPAYPRRRSPIPGVDAGRNTVPRMILTPYVDQIGRLMLRYFENNPAAAIAWFRKHWKCDNPRELGTTERAGQVIAALKRMLARKERACHPERSEGSPSPRGRGRAEERAIAVSAVLLLLLLFIPACIVTVAPLPPAECPPLVVCPPPERVFLFRPNDRGMHYFAACMSGPGQPLDGHVDYVPCDWLVDCLAYLDLDTDGDIDLSDFAVWQRRVLCLSPSGTAGGVP